MRRLLGPTALALLVSTSLIGAPAAGAKVEVGNLCEAKFVTAAEATAVQLTQSSPSALPPTAPFAGVVTSWRVNVTFTNEEFPQRLKVLRGAGPTIYTVVGESEPAIVSGGINFFDTRIPVEAGDRFAAAGRPFLCETEPVDDAVGVVPGNAPLGSSPDFGLTAPKRLLSLTASVEPDADRDGYGDETQDLCPSSAARQTACPLVTTNAAPIVRKGRVLVLVTTTGAASVTVAGTVSLPKRAVARLAPVTRTVAPPTIGRFMLTLPAKVKRVLAEKGTATLTVRATVTDDIGRVSSDNGTVRLR